MAIIKTEEKVLGPKFLCPCGDKMRGTPHAGAIGGCTKNHQFMVIRAAIETRATAINGDREHRILIGGECLWDVTQADDNGVVNGVMVEK